MNRRTTGLSLLVVTVLLGAAPLARADMMDNLKKTTPKERATIQTGFLKSKLGLSPEETAKVEAINLKYAEKAEPVIQGSEGPFAKMRQMKEIQSEKDAEMQATLSPAQFQAYEAAKDEMKQKFEEAVAKKMQGGS